ncbi:uncharacterized protein LOC110603442 [Manihot esculenta]|uniref:Oxidative stress 3 n=1 Tax=Manihot esculenta TaxID=3983 RepID=A0A2C9UAR4_MANES|nr:uncharacterized protein LOC110603442 [Manihot esculenta]OAY27199.1 hypothetical protein MANES_16G107900v8 [Manihot esculenta]
MAEAAEQNFLDMTLQKINPNRDEQDLFWVGGNGASEYESTTAESSMEASISSTDLEEDASSSSSTLNGPLYELSELMAQLPVKRGLSKFYQGKSQSYTSLASVKSLEDLAKKVTVIPYRSKMKSCKSYARVLDVNKCYSPKAAISKRDSRSRGSFLSSLGRR